MANEYRVSQVTIEVLDDGAANARVSQLTAEALTSGVAAARVSSVYLEVLRVVPSTVRRRQIVN